MAIARARAGTIFAGVSAAALAMGAVSLSAQDVDTSDQPAAVSGDEQLTLEGRNRRDGLPAKLPEDGYYNSGWSSIYVDRKRKRLYHFTRDGNLFYEWKFGEDRFTYFQNDEFESPVGPEPVSTLVFVTDDLRYQKPDDSPSEEFKRFVETRQRVFDDELAAASEAREQATGTQQAEAGEAASAITPLGEASYDGNAPGVGGVVNAALAAGVSDLGAAGEQAGNLIRSDTTVAGDPAAQAEKLARGTQALLGFALANRPGGDTPEGYQAALREFMDGTGLERELIVSALNEQKTLTKTRRLDNEEAGIDLLLAEYAAEAEATGVAQSSQVQLPDWWPEEDGFRELDGEKFYFDRGRGLWAFTDNGRIFANVLNTDGSMTNHDSGNDSGTISDPVIISEIFGDRSFGRFAAAAQPSSSAPELEAFLSKAGLFEPSDEVAAETIDDIDQVIDDTVADATAEAMDSVNDNIEESLDDSMDDALDDTCFDPNGC